MRCHLEDVTGLTMETAPDLIEATADAGIFMTLSGTLKRAAVKLSKICNDLRLLSSGPQAGFGEISLPARQAGSSIMPGKVNPVIPEVVNQVAFSVIGADATVTAAAEAGQLQLNAFEPVIAHSLLQSLAWMTNACYTLRVNCIDGITANTARLSQSGRIERRRRHRAHAVHRLRGGGRPRAHRADHERLDRGARRQRRPAVGGGGRPRAVARAAQRRWCRSAGRSCCPANSSAGA